MPDASTTYQRFQPWRRPFEIGFWLVITLVNGVANSVTVLMDVRRVGLGFATWQPATWELSSGVVMLALVPALVWFTRRLPLHWDTLRSYLPWYVLGSVAFSVLHVLAMVALRKLVYASQGMVYDFGPWPRELFYEYLKDARSFAGMVVMIEGYRFALRRWQGEASVLDEPDEGLAQDPVGRPERFLVRKLGREFLVTANDIEWLQASGNYVNLHMAGRDYPLRSTLAGIEARLDPARFVRVHRSYMVNLQQLVSIEPVDSGDARLHLKDGTTLPCSRRYRGSLKAT